MSESEGLPHGARIHRILANGVALLLAYALPRVFTLTSVIVAARWLGVEKFGAYGTAAAFSVIASVAATLGMLPLLVREIAKGPERAGDFLGAAHVLKVASGSAMVIGAAWAAMHLFEDAQVRAAAFVLSLGWVMNAFAENLAAYYQALERMARWAQASALFGVVSACVGVTLLLITGDLVAYCWGFVAGWASAFVWLWAGLPVELRRSGLPDASAFKRLLSGLAPFAIAFVGIALYSKMDVLLLERWRGAEEVGIYSAAYKFVDVFQALLVAAAGAVYPHLSRMSDRHTHLGRARSMEIILLVSVPAGLILHLVGSPLVSLVFGAGYTGSADVLSRLALLLPLLGITILGGYVLGASGRMTPVAAMYALGIAANYGLNRLLIPVAGAVGAATARLASEALLAAGLIWVLSRAAGAAPRPRSLMLAGGCALGAAGCALLPDPSGGWIRGALFTSMVAVVYTRGHALSGTEVEAVRRAVLGRIQATPTTVRPTP